MSYDYQLCPECGEEFTLGVSQCSDCGVALVPPDAVGGDTPEAFPEISELARVRVGPLPWTRALSEALSQQAIAHRVEPETRSEAEGGVAPGAFAGLDVYGTWVRPEDLAAASQLDSELFAHLEPDAQPPSEGGESCPACEAPLVPDSVECGECGLAFA